MMSITDQALELLADVVERAPRSDTVALRLVPEKEGWAMKLDEPRPGDETFEHRDRTVLILDGGVAERLQDSTLDVDDFPEGRRLALR